MLIHCMSLFPDGIRYSKLNSRAGAQEAHGVGGAGSPWHEEVSVAVVKADRAAGCADMILQHLIRVIRNLPSFIPDGAKADAPPMSPPRSGESIRIISSRFPIRTDTLELVAG